MDIHQFYKIQPLTLMHDSVNANLTGVAAKDLVFIIIDRDVPYYKEIQGTGKFTILYPFMGKIQYKFSEDDWHLPSGNYTFYVKYKNDVEGTAIYYECQIG